MSDHFIEKCPCGIIVNQCRCAEGIGEKKTVRIVKCQHPEPPVTDAYSPDSEWMNAPLGMPTMTDHAQRARDLWKKIADEMVLAKRAGMTNVELARYTDRRAIELIAFDRTEAHDAGRRAGLEEAATLYREWVDGKWFDAMEFGDALRAKAKEGA